MRSESQKRLLRPPCFCYTICPKSGRLGGVRIHRWEFPPRRFLGSFWLHYSTSRKSRPKENCIPVHRLRIYVSLLLDDGADNWWMRGDFNPYARRRWYLKPLCIAVPSRIQKILRKFVRLRSSTSSVESSFYTRFRKGGGHSGTFVRLSRIPIDALDI